MPYIIIDKNGKQIEGTKSYPKEETAINKMISLKQKGTVCSVQFIGEEESFEKEIKEIIEEKETVVVKPVIDAVPVEEEVYQQEIPSIVKKPYKEPNRATDKRFKDQKKDTRVNLLINGELLNNFKIISSIKGISINELINQLIEETIEANNDAIESFKKLSKGIK